MKLDILLKVIKSLTKSVWKKLPVTLSVRIFLKKFMFTLFPLLFARSLTYKKWNELRSLNKSLEHHQAILAKQAKQISSVGNNSVKIVVVSHDAHPHGAQFLALGIVRALCNDLHLSVEVLLLGPGRLMGEFQKLARVHDLSLSTPSEIANVANDFARRGFNKAIVNTTVSGSIIPVFAKVGIESVSLVHELPGVIRGNNLETQAVQIAEYAKAIVFPAHIVAEGFQQFAKIEIEKTKIYPQGLYRRNSWRLQKDAAKIKLCNELNLNLNTKIVLTVGYVDHRKGVDLYVESALRILSERELVDFIWVGHWDITIQKEIEETLSSSPYKNRIHFVGYNPDTSLFHAASDVYALTSREDPFPNVVLESFEVAVPVVAFKGTGGAAVLIDKVGGFLAPQFDIKKYSDLICKLLDDNDLSQKLGEEAQVYLDENFAFRPYLFKLCDILGISLPKISVIVPNFNYEQYIEKRLSSIVNQSMPIYELIILDDKSTDQSIKRISDWLVSTNTDARVISNKTNSGNVFKQWNIGVSLSKGDYVWIAEADDLSDVGFLETVLFPLVEDNVVISYCESFQMNAQSQVVSRNYQDYLKNVSEEKWQNSYIENGLDECRYALAVLNTIPNVSAVLFKAEIIKYILNYHLEEIMEYKRAGDWVVYMRTLAHGNIKYSSKVLNYHRRHEGSVIGNSDKQLLLNEIFSVQDKIATLYGIDDETRQKVENYRHKLINEFRNI